MPAACLSISSLSVNENDLISIAFAYFPFYTVKRFPSWMPGGRFKKQVVHARECIRDMYDVPFKMVREKMVRRFHALVRMCFHKLYVGVRHCVVLVYFNPSGTMPRRWEAISR